MTCRDCDDNIHPNCFKYGNVVENEKSEKITSTALRDKCDRLLGLMQCLMFVVDHPDLKSYVHNPHHHLMLTINDGIEEIESKLRDL